MDSQVKGLSYLSLVYDVVERANNFLHRGLAIRSVSVNEIDILEIQAFECTVDPLNNMLSR
jgi:hypothetical protein